MSQFSAYEYRKQPGFDMNTIRGREPGDPDEGTRDPLL